MNTKLFSRQIGAIGKDTMNKLIDINVLVIGENAIALECIKCLSLLGINSINLLIEENNEPQYEQQDFSQILFQNGVEETNSIHSILNIYQQENTQCIFRLSFGWIEWLFFFFIVFVFSFSFLFLVFFFF